MLKWFKRRVEAMKPCPHYKRSGEPWPANVVEVVRFSPYKKDTIGYAVNECTDCGTRMFSCIGLHMMGPQTTDAIDGFIGYRMIREEFAAFLEKDMKWVKWSENPPSTTPKQE